MLVLEVIDIRIRSRDGMTICNGDVDIDVNVGVDIVIDVGVDVHVHMSVLLRLFR